MKRLSIFIYSLGGGGAEKAAIELILGLKDDYNISVVLFSDVIKYELPANVTYTVLDSFDFYDNPIKKLFKLPLLAYKYANFCKQNKIGISLSLLSRPNIISILSRFFGNKSQIIISEHSTPSFYYGSSLSEKLMKFFIKSLFPLADKVISVSAGTKNDLIQNFNVKAANISIIHNPIDLDLIMRKTEEQISYDFDGFCFITCGRLIPSKNTSMIIEAFYKADIPNSKLIILGEGSEKEYLEILCKELGMSSRVHFAGFTQNPYAWFAKSSVFVFGSRLEALPTVLIEALVCGLPIISTDCPSGPDEILCGENKAYENSIKQAEYGLLVKLDDKEAFAQAMIQIHDNDTLRKNYKEIAFERAKCFDKFAIFEHYKAVLG